MFLVYMKLPRTANQKKQTPNLRRRPFDYLVSYRALQAKGGGGCISVCILNCLISFMLRPLYGWGKRYITELVGKLDESRAVLGMLVRGVGLD